MMVKLGCLSTALVICALLVGGLNIYISIWPATEVVVPLPMGQSKARIQSWGYFINPEPYVLVIDTPTGSVKADLWTDLGPAGTVNLYRTPENWLAALGGGGDNVIIDVVNPSGPRQIFYPDLPRKNDEDWVYLGKVIVGGGFLDSSKSTECFEMLGAGYSPYRQRFQVKNFCIESIRSK